MKEKHARRILVLPGPWGGVRKLWDEHGVDPGCAGLGELDPRPLVVVTGELQRVPGPSDRGSLQSNCPHFCLCPSLGLDPLRHHSGHSP